MQNRHKIMNIRYEHFPLPSSSASFESISERRKINYDPQETEETFLQITFIILFEGIFRFSAFRLFYDLSLLNCIYYTRSMKIPKITNLKKKSG